MKIRVTHDDINKGIRCGAGNCPVARATKRVCKREVSVGVDTLTIYRTDGPEKRYTLPPGVSRWICRFDTGEQVRPFRFSL